MCEHFQVSWIASTSFTLKPVLFYIFNTSLIREGMLYPYFLVAIKHFFYLLWFSKGHFYFFKKTNNDRYGILHPQILLPWINPAYITFYNEFQNYKNWSFLCVLIGMRQHFFILRNALPQLHNYHTRFFYSEPLCFNNTDTLLLYL